MQLETNQSLLSPPFLFHSQITVRSSPITHTHSDQLSVCRHCHRHCKSKPGQHSPAVSLSTSLKVQHSQATTTSASTSATPATDMHAQRRCCQSPTLKNTPTASRNTDDHECNASSKSASSSSSSTSSKASQTSQLSSQPSTLTGSCTMNAQLISITRESSESPGASGASVTHSKSHRIRGGQEAASRTDRAAASCQLHRQHDEQCHRNDDQHHSHRHHHQHHTSTTNIQPHQHRQHCPHHASGAAHHDYNDHRQQQQPLPLHSHVESETISSSEPPSMTSSCDSEATEPPTKRVDAIVSVAGNHPPVKPERFALQRQLLARQTPELRRETCKLVDNSSERYRSHAVTVERPAPPDARPPSNDAAAHKNCKCNCSRAAPSSDSYPVAAAAATDENDDDWSMMLIGLAQLQPATALVQMDPFKALPSIAVVPPTPTLAEGLFSQFCGSPNWSAEAGMAPPSVADQQVAGAAGSSGAEKPSNGDGSPEDSPQDEEPPYRSLNTSLKRYGTMSSLERFSSEDVEETKTLNSSDEDVNDADSELIESKRCCACPSVFNNGYWLFAGVRIITRDLHSNGDASGSGWTNRAGSFLEQSRAFLDSYLSRWDRGQDSDGLMGAGGGGGGGDYADDVDGLMDECTSGATSGEDVWGTPTSGENDEMQMFNSDHTNSVGRCHSS